MRLNRRKFWLALFSLLVTLGVVLPELLNLVCRSCIPRYLEALRDGEASYWPLYAANGILVTLTALAVGILAKRRGRRPRLWVLACLPLHVAAVCYLWALEPVPPGGERDVADDLDSARL